VGVDAPVSEEPLFGHHLLSALTRSRHERAAENAGYSLAGIAEVFTIGLFFSWLLR
jgi:hypothetical protein